MNNDQRHNETMNGLQQVLDQLVELRNQAADLFEEVAIVRSECIALHEKLDAMID